MDMPNFDPLLQGLLPGIVLIFGTLLLSVAAALVTDGIVHAVTWTLGRTERRKAREIDLMRQLIRDWHDGPGEPPTNL